MLSGLSRFLTRLVAVLFALVGIVLFLAPAWSAANFAWKISPFIAMTMGGWCLGNAVFAWESARLWRWSLIYPCLIFLWLFGIFQSLVLVAFRDRVILNVPMAWPYILTLGVTVLAAVIGFVDLLRLRPRIRYVGPRVNPYVRTLIILFTIFVGLLAVYGSLARQGGLSTEGRIFPENLTLFTVRAFAAFFAAISLSALPLIWARGIDNMKAYARAGLVLIVPIVVAALFNLDKFDFVARPGGILYIGAYVVTFVLTLYGLYHYRAPAPEGSAQPVPGGLDNS